MLVEEGRDTRPYHACMNYKYHQIFIKCTNTSVLSYEQVGLKQQVPCIVSTSIISPLLGRTIQDDSITAPLHPCADVESAADVPDCRTADNPNQLLKSP